MKTFNFRAPQSMKLHKMQPEEIEKFVAKEADRVFKTIPKEVRPVGVNSVTIDSVAKGTAAEPGVWAQWTRACCDKRRQIEDYRDMTQADLAEIAEQRRIDEPHVETNFSVQVKSNPKMH
jgi:hypothetical protein